MIKFVVVRFSLMEFKKWLTMSSKNLQGETIVSNVLLNKQLETVGIYVNWTENILALCNCLKS